MHTRPFNPALSPHLSAAIRELKKCESTITPIDDAIKFNMATVYKIVRARVGGFDPQLYSTDKEDDRDIIHNKITRLTQQFFKGQTVDKSSPDYSIFRLFSFFEHSRQAVASLNDYKQQLCSEMTEIVKSNQFPAKHWFNGIRGCTYLGFARIIANSGDLGSYKHISSLWNRFGLYTAHGEVLLVPDSPENEARIRRRTVIWQYTEPVINLNDGEFRRAYEEYAAKQTDKFNEMQEDEQERLAVSYMHKGFYDFGTAGHVRARARRFISKLLLKELLRRWRLEINAPVDNDPIISG